MPLMNRAKSLRYADLLVLVMLSPSVFSFLTLFHMLQQPQQTQKLEQQFLS